MGDLECSAHCNDDGLQSSLDPLDHSYADAVLDKGRLPPFVPLLIDTLDTPAWRALSHGARSLYVSLKRRYSQNTHNNGRIFLSERSAEKEMRSHRDQIRRWFRIPV
jgi:hypothetical protein